MIRGMEQLCCDERLGVLKLFSLKKCRGDLIVAFQCLKGTYRRYAERQFTRDGVRGQERMVPH